MLAVYFVGWGWTVSAMIHAVNMICLDGVPSKIIDSIVQAVAVAVTPFQLAGSWADKRFEDDVVDAGCAILSVAPNENNFVTRGRRLLLEHSRMVRVSSALIAAAHKYRDNVAAFGGEVAIIRGGCNLLAVRNLQDLFGNHFGSSGKIDSSPLAIMRSPSVICQSLSWAAFLGRRSKGTTCRKVSASWLQFSSVMRMMWCLVAAMLVACQDLLDGVNGLLAVTPRIQRAAIFNDVPTCAAHADGDVGAANMGAVETVGFGYGEYCGLKGLGWVHCVVAAVHRAFLLASGLFKSVYTV